MSTIEILLLQFFFSSRRRHTRCALVTGVQTCALPICSTIKEPHMRPYALLAALVLCSIAAPVGAQPALPAAIPPPDSDPVVETRFGITTTDPFRRLEDLKDSEVQAWMKEIGRAHV